MSNVARNLVFLSGFIVMSAFAVRGVQYYEHYKHNKEKVAVSKVNQAIEDIKKDAIEKHPDMPLSESMGIEAIEKARVKLISETDTDKRFKHAVSMFMGFYLVNARERLEFCREQGVDITPFVEAFERGHSSELAIARAAFSTSPVTEEKLYTMLKPQMRQTITQDMNDLASGLKASLAESCQMLVSHSSEIAAEMHVSKVQPAVFKVLTTGQ